MAYCPPYIVLDFETALTDGTPSVEYYRGDFRAISAAFAWRAEDGSVKTRYCESEGSILAYLDRIQSQKISLVVHNYQFEYGVLLHRFSGHECLVAHDTMRLVQVADNGGKYAHMEVKPQTYDDLLDSVEGSVEKATHTTGLGLVAAASRWLPSEMHDHKAPYHKWLRDNCGVKKGQEGQHLTKLPADMLEAYNVADAVVTLHLFETLQAEFKRIGYDPSLDHRLYASTAKHISKAKGIGARVDRDALKAYVAEIETEVAGIEGRFRVHFKDQVQALESEATEAWVMALKSQKGRDKRRKQAETTPIRFNVGSTKQLKHLFVDVLGVTVKFWTKEPKAKNGKPRKKEFVPQPSFKSAHLSTYGAGGELLIKRRKRLLVLKQANALINLSEHDGKWHWDLRAAGTATGRMSGGRI